MASKELFRRRGVSEDQVSHSLDDEEIMFQQVLAKGGRQDMMDFQHHEEEGAGDAELDSVQTEHLKLLEKIGIGFDDDDDDELGDGDVR